VSGTELCRAGGRRGLQRNKHTLFPVLVAGDPLAESALRRFRSGDAPLTSRGPSTATPLVDVGVCRGDTWGPLPGLVTDDLILSLSVLIGLGGLAGRLRREGGFGTVGPVWVSALRGLSRVTFHPWLCWRGSVSATGCFLRPDTAGYVVAVCAAGAAGSEARPAPLRVLGSAGLEELPDGVFPRS
jgi:hypothetical protein